MAFLQSNGTIGFFRLAIRAEAHNPTDCLDLSVFKNVIGTGSAYLFPILIVGGVGALAGMPVGGLLASHHLDDGLPVLVVVRV